MSSNEKLDLSVFRTQLENMLREFSMKVVDIRLADEASSPYVDSPPSIKPPSGIDDPRHALIVEAISRIDDGSYGTCKQCKKKIDIERLEIIPEAARCIDCQKQVEGSTGAQDISMIDFDEFL